MRVSERSAKLTAQFYEWELLGRGWLSADNPIQLEPEFIPFFGHFLRPQVISDDGLRHTLLSSIASAFKKKKELSVPEMPPAVSYQLFPFEAESYLVGLRLLIPRQFKVNIADTEQLLMMLSYCTNPISFEIFGTREKITIQFVCQETDVLYVKSQLTTFFKGIPLLEFNAEAEEEQLFIEERPVATVDFGLQEEFMRPILQYKGGGIDPLTGLLSILEHLREGEQVVFQVLFNGLLNYWKQSIMSAVTDAKGEPFFADAPDMLPLAKEKLSTSLLTATIRMLAQAKTLDESFALLHKLNFAIVTNTHSSSNALLPLSNENYTVEQRIDDIEFRESHRAGMLLNVKELATFIHVPDQSLISKKLIGENRKTKAAPSLTDGHPLILGVNVHEGVEKTVTMSDAQRLKHVHIIGATGTGKSTLLLNMIEQDIGHGKGIAVLDPHGDLIEAILSRIPQARIKDVLLIDPSDSEFPVGFNILKAHTDIEKEVLSSDLVAAFRRLSTSWGDQMNSVFANAILAFLESSKGGTVIDLRRFLIEKTFRDTFLQTVADPGISYYWHREYPLLKTSSIGPILTRLDAFLRPRLIRNMVAQEQGIDFEAVLNKKKILLVKLSQGLIGGENSYLLGTFVVSKIHQAALARQATQVRNDFFCYIDEFQHFVTPSMAHILSGARKYHLGLILVHQDLQQLQKSDSELLSTLIANAGTRICFRLGDADAKRLADGFSYFESHDLQNLGTGEAIARIERPEFDFSMSTTIIDHRQEIYASSEAVVTASRNTYSTSKEAIEEMLRESMKGSDAHEIKETIKPDAPRPPLHKLKETPFEVTPESDSNPTVSVSETEKVVAAVIEKKQEKEHRYLQTLIKMSAESKGYKATLEMPTPDKKGYVDVAIEGRNIRIACEISVTTDSTWELHNIEKGLAAGYNIVFVCCADKKMVNQLRRKAKEKFSDSEYQGIIIDEVDALTSFLDQHNEQEVSTETTHKGYRVKVEYDSISKEAMDKKREAIAKVITDSLKRLKK